MHRAPLPIRIAALLGAIALFLVAGGGALAVADDYRTRDILPAGAAAGGVDLTGLSRSQALDLVTASVAEPLAKPLTVRYGERRFEVDASRYVTVDVETMIATAFEPRVTAPLADRVLDRTLGRPAGAQADVLVTVDEAALDAWVDDVASRVDTSSVDATLTITGGALELVPSRVGESVDRTAARAALKEALAKGQKTVDLPVALTEPVVGDDDLGRVIVVDISERTLVLYDGVTAEKSYRVAVGTPGHPTPRGSFQITLKRYMPTWSNPGSAWAAAMPRSIPPGPSNPLGTRALNLSAPGIRIHGTSANSSIGTAASHGCIRMHRWDIEDLYERVGVGTPVFIVR